MSSAPEPGQTPLVLVVDDEPQVLRFLRASLPHQGYRLIEAVTGEEALREASLRAPDAILLDLGLPDIHGVEVTRRLREWSAVPIVVLSARGQESDKIEALDAGADDYLTKPFGIGELLARLRVALRHSARAGDGGEPVFEHDGLRVDLAAQRVFSRGEEVRLTRTEYRLLALLVKHAGKVLTHRQLLKEVWGPGSVNESHYLRVYMGQLRHKLEEEPARPRHLVTEIGVGYRLKVD
jgi:two-component system, OmpR family, KDP operon response regulator KdpE